MGKRTKEKLTRKHKIKIGICDRCKRTHTVTEYWFQDVDKKWTNWWCEDCFDHWINLNTETIKVLRETIAELSKRWPERIINKIKELLRINRGKK